MKRFDFALLDCTLRDGGYQTDWQFDDGTVARYLDLCTALKPFGVEIGYLGLASGQRLRQGSYRDLPWSLSADQLAMLEARPSVAFGVMVDARHLVGRAPAEAIDELVAGLRRFPRPASFLRLAATSDELTGIAPIAAAAVDSLQIDVFVNIMRIGAHRAEELADTIGGALRGAGLTAVYLADSFGQMRPGIAGELVAQVRRRMDAPVGFHAHDNLGLAIANTVAAVDAGAEFADGALGGLGRGAGNAMTESLALLRPEDRPCDWTASCDLFLARDIEQIRARHAWGTSPAYRVQARSNVHPTYAQRLAEMEELSEVERIHWLWRLAQSDAPDVFDQDRLMSARAS